METKTFAQEVKVLVSIRNTYAKTKSKLDKDLHVLNVRPLAMKVGDLDWTDELRDNLTHFTIHSEYHNKLSSTLVMDNVIVITCIDKIEGVTGYEKDGVFIEHESSGLQVVSIDQANRFDVNDLRHLPSIGNNIQFIFNVLNTISLNNRNNNF